SPGGLPLVSPMRLRVDENPHGYHLVRYACIGSFTGRIAPALLGAFLYSITSSAIARSGGGIFRPSALAVRKFKTNSTFVDWVTGRSLGTSPLRMRAAHNPTRRYASPRSLP